MARQHYRELYRWEKRGNFQKHQGWRYSIARGAEKLGASADEFIFRMKDAGFTVQLRKYGDSKSKKNLLSVTPRLMHSVQPTTQLTSFLSAQKFPQMASDSNNKDERIRILLMSLKTGKRQQDQSRTTLVVEKIMPIRKPKGDFPDLKSTGKIWAMR